MIKYGAKKGMHRVFGGVNLLRFGDWWQLPHVNATAFFSNPFKAKTAVAQSGLNMFWEKGQNSINHLCELTEQMRCTDPWHQHVLAQCRNGEQGE